MPVDGLATKSWGQTPDVPRPGLIPTVTGCVRTGQKLGLWGENNNGALTFWIVEFKPGTNYNPDAGGPIAYNVPLSSVGVGKLTLEERDKKGFIVTDNQYHLVRWTVFWHSPTGCYGDPDHSPNGKMDTGTSKPGTRPPGSEDPSSSGGSGGGLPEVKDTKVTETLNKPGDPKDKSGTRITITTFVDGSQLIVTDTLDKKGDPILKKRITENKPAPPGSGGTAGTIKQGGSLIVTPPSELRNQSKLGRVSWHELIRE